MDWLLGVHLLCILYVESVSISILNLLRNSQSISPQKVTELSSGIDLGLERILALADHVLSLGSVVTDVLLGDLGGLGSVLAGNAAQLLGLRVNHIRGLLQVVVNQLLVGGVNERGKEGDGGCDESQAPVGNNLDQVVREECRESNLFRGGK